jgi:hypothetical protein
MADPAPKRYPGPDGATTVSAARQARQQAEQDLRIAHTLATRALARRATARYQLSRAVVEEQIARGALFDPRDLFEAEDGEEVYKTDGPLREDGLGNWAPAWKKGEVKRQWAAGDLKPLHRLTEAQAQSISSIEMVMKNATAGDGQIDRVLRIRLAPREKYVELGARMHGMLIDKTESRVDVHVVGSRLDAARARFAALGYGTQPVLEAHAEPEAEEPSLPAGPADGT